MLKVIPFIYDDIDELRANTYIIKDNNSCIVIDPSTDNDKIGDFIEKNSLDLKAILLTHSHIDHMRGVNRLINRFGCQLYVGFDDEIGLVDQYYNCGEMLLEKCEIKSNVNTVSDNEILKILSEDIKVIYTPFHTKGSVCYYLSNSSVLFSGDTLFKKVIGRTDLPSSSRATLRSSLQKLRLLPDDVKVYPGHGEFTTIGFEKSNNLFLNR